MTRHADMRRAAGQQQGGGRAEARTPGLWKRWHAHAQVYNERVYMLSVNCAKEAAKLNVKRFIEVSTAQVYEEGKVGGAGRARPPFLWVATRR